MLLEEFDANKTAIINPDMCVEKIENFPEVTISCFSEKLFNEVLKFFRAKEIASVHSASGLNPIYEVTYKGKRFAMPNAEILIHQPLIGGGGLSGQATEIKIHADHMVKTREKLNKILSDRTGQPIDVINRDTERDHYMTAQEALEYGLIDGIMEKRK